MLADKSETGSRDAARAVLAGEVVRTAAGDRRAFQAVYRATSAKLFGVILRICGEREAAEEVLQDVYATVWRKAGQFDPARASPITWLATIARNKAIDRARSMPRPGRQRPIEEAEHVADGGEAQDSAVERSQEHERLEHCLGELEPHHAEAIRTAFFEGRTYEALAGDAGVPVGTMKSWIRRSLMRLRSCLEQ